MCQSHNATVSHPSVLRPFTNYQQCLRHSTRSARNVLEAAKQGLLGTMADVYNRITGRHFNDVNVATLLKFTDLDPRVQKHLAKVYTTLTFAVALATLGVVADLVSHVGGILTTVAALGSLIWLGFTTPADNPVSAVCSRRCYAGCHHSRC
eukprot:GHUV01057997.1.p1 GENE.GHUV01057997.1~~GHUV01057997.1.p1  ORF type:complete len:151 (-),score=10.66 GHUV01057997.1:468-920(-)